MNLLTFGARTMAAAGALLFLACASRCLAEQPSRWGLDESKLSELHERHRRAEDHIVAHRFDEALGEYQEILFLEADDEVAYVNTGRIHLILGNFDKAQSAFENALDVNPQNEEALAGLERIADPDGRRLSAPLPEESFPAP